MRDLTEVEEILSQINLEYDLLLLWRNIFWIFKQINEKRFLSEKQDYRNKIETELKNFVTTHAQNSGYYLDRCSTSKNESDKLRYSFICWFLVKDPNHLKLSIQIACNVITNSLKLKYEKSKDYILPCDLLSYAYTLFTFYIPNDSNVKRIIKDRAFEIIDTAKQNNFNRWLIEPSEIVSNLLDNDDHDLASKLILNLHQGAESLSRQENIPIDNQIGNCHIERELLDRSKLFIPNLNLTNDEKDKRRRQIHAMIAKSYEREAQIRQKKGEPALILANICYLPAAKEYQLAGEKEKSAENFVLYQKNNYFPADAYHEYSITIPKSDSNIFEGKNEDEIIRSMSESNLVIPDQENVANQISNDTTTHPIALGIPHQKLTEYGPAAKIASKPEEIKNHLIKERMILHIQLHENFLCQNFLKLEESIKVTKEGLSKYISKFLILDDNTSDLIRLGLTHHFNRDYVASIHILIPQLENVLRIIVKNSNINVLKQDNEAIMNKQFRGLLEMPEVCKIIGTDLSKYLIVKYADPKSINLRNEVSHGLLKVIDFNHANSCAVIYGLLKLLDRFQKYKTKN